ncbi:MAG: GIY-YIG nuclease family protein [Fulvivirga sp.]|uniref:GIY-YIG nuclease family protein n=1 Tax=Fulvivirga sp. TaxID=1931237 RepID=UPI0032EE7894
MYILLCSDGSYYTGSTKDLEIRLEQHQSGKGAKHTKKRLPVKLVYYERYPRIDWAFEREKQVQGWSRKKKEALINDEHHKLPELAIAYRDLSPEANLSPEVEAEELEVLEGRLTNNDPEMLSSRASDNKAKLSPEVLEGRLTKADPETLASRASASEQRASDNNANLRAEALEARISKDNNPKPPQP